MTDTARVSSRSACSTCAGVTRPSVPGLSQVTSKPSRSSCRQASITALCSVREVTRWRPRGRPARADPSSARLSLSVAPEVNTIAPGGAPTRAATCPLARSIAAAARPPSACAEDGFACGPSGPRQAAMAAATSGCTGQLAA